MAIAADVRAELETALGKAGVLWQPADLKLYEYDGGVDKALPEVVVFPRSTEQVVAAVRVARENNMAIVGREIGRAHV